jgi:hypothetical protein
MGLIKFLLITICILWILRIVFRLLLPYIFQKLVNKVQHQAGQSFQQQYRSQNNSQQQHRNRPDGALKVDYVPPKEKEARAADRAGDFVDFEEIKDK